jgi:exonuclease SbcC
MNPNSSPYGSIWRKWDLHFHTPASYDYQYKGATNAEIVEGLIKAGVEVVAITDHHRIDGERIRELQRLGGAQLTVLPGIELRSELGGSTSVHFIGIFPEDADIATLWTKLSGRLNITENDIEKKGDDNVYCSFVDTCELIRELGGIVSVHAGRKSNSIEELKNSDYIKQIVKKDLVRDCIDIYEASSPEDIKGYREKVFPHLDRAIPIVVCSDNHDIRKYAPAHNLWIKGDKTFETLRQTLFEPIHRVMVSNDKPISPLLTIRSVDVNFPENAEIINENGEGQRRDKFCFRTKNQIIFSPYFTCLIGGRGSGKSTLLNLIHEKLEPGKTRFFSDNELFPREEASIARCVSIDGAEQKAIEFLQQNEIEQLAAEPLRLTDAIFARLRKLDLKGELGAVETELLPAMIETSAQAERLKSRDQLAKQIAESEKELATKKALVASFQDQEYRVVNEEMAVINREIQSLRGSKQQLEKLIRELQALKARYVAPNSAEPNEYEKEHLAILGSLEQLSKPISERETLRGPEAREAHLTTRAMRLKARLEDFLKGRGLSQENLADVGKANERVAQLEQDLPSLKRQLDAVSAQVTAFTDKRQLRNKYDGTVTKLLTPLNETLRDLSKEVKQIRLEYEFDASEFREAIIEHIQKNVGGETLRIDYLASVLETIDFQRLTTSTEFVDRLPTNSATAKALRDYYSIELNFALLRMEVEKRYIDFGSYGRIKISYDGRPIENSSFGQRCTAVIVILLLLGNTPIFIDEPEAHLDSALIANYLVELVKEAKLNRQIIFATHNANFVINGDAELVHVLDMDGDRISKFESITIENIAHRGKLLALEGGPEAFAKRESRYGIRRPNRK